ncbi:hypothetical protein BDR03DRAFT_1017718 [Suillus americanus]|nr:hypothetical protein BDR03DRAFT_1017718 [Suillus americanus]
MSLARTSMVKAMAANQAVARFIASLLPTAMRATMHDYIASSPALDEGIVVFPPLALLAPFQTSHNDANATASLLISLSSAAVAAIVEAMATSAAPKGKRDMKDNRSSEQFIKVAIAVCSSQEELGAFHASTGNLCLKIPTFTEELRRAVQFVGAEKYILPLLECLKPRLDELAVSSLYAAILSATGTPLRLLERLVSSLIRLILTGNDEEFIATSMTNAACVLLSLVHQCHVDILRDAKERKKKADELMISFSVSHLWAQSANISEIVAASTSSTKEAHVEAVERLYNTLRKIGHGKGRPFYPLP